MLALVARQDGGTDDPIPHARLAKDLDLPRTTVKRNLVRLAQDGLPVERTAEGWRASLGDTDRLDRAVALLLSDRSRWPELLASPFPRVLPETYLAYRLEMLLHKVLTSKAVKESLTADAIREFLAMEDDVPADSLLRDELPKAALESIRSAGDARDLHDRLHALVGDGTPARVQLPRALLEAHVPMLRRSPTLLQTSLDPRPFGFSAARFDGRRVDPSGKDLVPGLLSTVCTLIYDADVLLTPEPEARPERAPPERPPEAPRPSEATADVRETESRWRAFARRFSRAPPPLVAEAPLCAREVRDLADRVPDLVASTEGLDLLFTLRLELRGTPTPRKDLVERANRILKRVSDDLELR